MIARTPEQFARAGIEVRLQTRVTRIQAAQQTVQLHSGDFLPFDYLVMATGAAPRLPGVPGEDLEGVFLLRNLTDALRIKEFVNERQPRRALLVGAGYVCLEMSEAFRRLGIDTTIVHRGELPMARLGRDFGEKIVEELDDNGVH